MILLHPSPFFITHGVQLVLCVSGLNFILKYPT